MWVACKYPYLSLLQNRSSAFLAKSSGTLMERWMWYSLYAEARTMLDSAGDYNHSSLASEVGLKRCGLVGVVGAVGTVQSCQHGPVVDEISVE